MFFINKKLPMEQKGLYCTWIRRNDLPGAPLVAVWIDPAMRSFEQSAARENSGTETVLTCEDGGEQIGSSPCSQGSESPWDWRPAAVRGLAAMLV